MPVFKEHGITVNYEAAVRRTGAGFEYTEEVKK